MPGGIALRHGERPVEKIPHMRQDLNGAAAGAVEIGEGLRGILDGPGGSVSKRGEGMTEQVAFFVHAENIAQVGAGRWIRAQATAFRQQGLHFGQGNRI